MEQLYFNGIKVGPTLFKLLEAARRRFMRFDFAADRDGSHFSDKDDWGLAHVPSITLSWVVSHQTHALISMALTELYQVDYANVDLDDRMHVRINIDEDNVRNGLKQYLSTCLTWFYCKMKKLEPWLKNGLTRSMLVSYIIMAAGARSLDEFRSCR